MTGTIYPMARLDSATKYPSIPTYHTLDPKKRGYLTEDAVQFDGPAILTEKINGLNTRVIKFPDGDHFIGSRDELLYARGDRVLIKKDGVVKALRGFADDAPAPTSGFRVYFLELYGHKLGKADKEYTGGENVGYRLFDIADISIDVLLMQPPQISTWRDGGGQEFFSEKQLHRSVDEMNGLVGLAPRLGTVPGESLPQSLVGMQDWIRQALPQTNVALDEAARRQGEGVVLRSHDRKVIAKARFENYTRTLGNPTR